jgi:hypothetical protein
MSLEISTRVGFENGSCHTSGISQEAQGTVYRLAIREHIGEVGIDDTRLVPAVERR